jgi:hypothetical protein
LGWVGAAAATNQDTVMQKYSKDSLGLNRHFLECCCGKKNGQVLSLLIHLGF